MDVRINKSLAKGIAVAPPSKSMAHRYIICAALSKGKSVITNVDYSQDILATIECAVALGAHITKEDSMVTVEGIDLDNLPSNVSFMCRESGSTMRFFMGIALSLGIKASFYGSETLRNRPFGIYEEICQSQNLKFERNSDNIYVEGQIECGHYDIKGNISSQFITGLMLGLVLRDKKCDISLIPPVESKSYLDLTIKAMNDFGIDISWDGLTDIIFKPAQSYNSRNIKVEGDFSNAAFLDAFNYIGGNVSVDGLSEDSLQGDRVYLELFDKLSEGYQTIDISDCPDLGPVLFIVAAANHGGVFTGTKRLKIKESDRGSVMCEELSKFGVDTKIEENSITIGKICNKTISEPIMGHNDHRIVMSFAVLLSSIGGTICGSQAISKSFPDFFDVIKELGIEVETIGMD